MKRIVFHIIFLGILLIQNVICLKAQYADCNNMLVLKDTIYSTNPISGYGLKREFEGNELADKKIFEQEENTIWYLLEMPTDGVFTFDILTQNKEDDWDFLLFEYKKYFCKRIEAKKDAPIRTNLSRSPITGLSKEGETSFVGAGLNSNYSRPLRVNKGEQYVLVVNNPKRSGGKHTLVLHYPRKKIPVVKTDEETKEVEEEKREVQTTAIKLSVKDKLTNELISCDLIITGLKKRPIELDSITNYETQVIKKNRTVYINANAPGYMLTTKELKIGKNEVTFSAEILLERLTPGKKVNLKKLQFFGNVSTFLPSARSSLKSLLSFMEQNPRITIEVEGHVNGPGKKNSKDYQDLSYRRAYAVKDYLISNGINKERIDFKGYGNSKMLYPDPKSEYQESANRRVEIKIVSDEFNPGTGNVH